ncbi:proteoglycan Cow isoform X1 [Tribolium madens]|uniref:proteoglycan Cow isoform X1 n=1 Tax=Tribolium madens TaxID=41895 RepID=UPI001CF71D34|nr:proteoglycan Cow isoform X1 [Tribolium madens]
MRVILVLVVAAAVVCTTDAKRKRKFDGDFEFAEEDEAKAARSGEKKRWIHDPSSDLCRPLNCKKKEICLLEDSFTAVCVSRKELKKNGDIVVPKSTVKTEESKNEDDDDDDVFYDTEDDPDDADEDLNDSVVCKPCPVVKPTFLCGSDNRTYSSLCRLDYHNCIHHTSIRVTCKGFCPCKENEAHLRKKQRQSERLNSFMNKYKATLDKSGTVGGSINGAKPAQPSSKSDVYTFTPQDFKYENKHYKYIKYTKYNKQDNNNLLYAEDKDRLRGYNEVTDNKLYSNSIGVLDPAISPSKQCSSAALQAMGNRLLDWFSVVMADSSKRRRPRNKSKAHFPSACKGEVRWMFQHLDSNSDSKLSLQELYDLEHDQSEVCLKPFLQQCDIDRDVTVTPLEWCRCFQRTERPCAAVKRKITPELLGVYVPDCDSQGYYRPTQCHSAIGMCWCVDKHGVEFANTRTHAKPNCEVLINKSNGVSKQTSADDASDDEDGDDVEQDIEGSADHPGDY